MVLSADFLVITVTRVVFTNILKGMGIWHITLLGFLLLMGFIVRSKR
jgi:hypothetical protein